MLNYFNNKKKFYELFKIYDQEIEEFSILRNKEDEELRIKQEREMQEANLKRLQLDLIVNRHIDEITKFNYQSEEKLIKLISIKRDNFLQNLENIFQEFFENIKSTDLIYNSENKLVQIKFKKYEINNNLISASSGNISFDIGNQNLVNYSNLDQNSNLINLSIQGKLLNLLTIF